jgi:hypothetical protein
MRGNNFKGKRETNNFLVSRFLGGATEVRFRGGKTLGSKMGKALGCADRYTESFGSFSFRGLEPATFLPTLSRARFTK